MKTGGDKHTVAEGLRRLAENCDEDGAVSLFDVMLECGMDPEEFLAESGQVPTTALSSPGWTTAFAVETLADLIDRPTCRNLTSNGYADGGGKHGRFTCSRCKYLTVRSEGWTFNYCPICGASVTG